MNDHVTTPTERDVLAVMAGESTHQVASRNNLTARVLADAVATYRAAGRAALTVHTAGWLQTHIEFPDWASAERTAALHLWPRLQEVQTNLLSQWWFIRKAPHWRIRYRPSPQTSYPQLRTWITDTLSVLTGQGHLADWCETIYEPEVHAFGGPAALDIAHQLFHADSNGALAYLSHHHIAGTPVGRRELSILLHSLLMRHAKQDWYEQGDIWARVAQHRPCPADVPPERLHSARHKIQRLLIADTESFHGMSIKEQCPPIVEWSNAMKVAGGALAASAQDGSLCRGIRELLAHMVLFNWNRLRISFISQGILASAARDAIFGELVTS